MTIHITDCSTGMALYHASVTDIYGGVAYTDQYGNIQVTPGYEGYYYNTLISVSDYTYITAEFTLTSLGVNSFCLTPSPDTGGTSGGGY